MLYLPALIGHIKGGTCSPKHGAESHALVTHLVSVNTHAGSLWTQGSWRRSHHTQKELKDQTQKRPACDPALVVVMM